ncbi:flavin monoamine oxidase family protein [Jiangella alba]|uniref:Monoamine oxidase n=1 Tax=Jiangella alba TaxID=561176 RepID=A0A1H5PZW5_9ACTN|nr:NAD(P)/FAD-dependent oxidoreductase [Jiangella alba]SEF18741.1 Monoamine oxidase [Jiangella alba]
MSHERTDVVVIGGGFAGVTAAREMAATGASVVLLEARDRLGGRTWTTEFEGEPVELGGTWVHWTQQHIWSELTRHGIAIQEDDWDFDAAIMGSPPRRRPAPETFARLKDLFVRFVGEHRASLPLAHDPLHRYDQIAELDRLSMDDRLRQLDLADADVEYLTSLLFEIAGTELGEAGYLQVVRWLALCDWSTDQWYEMNRYRPVGGTAAVLDAMLGPHEVDVRLADPVASVRYGDDGALVRTSGGAEIACRHVIVAVPVNTWNRIEFDPPLPETHRAAMRQWMGKPRQDKVFLKVSGDIGRVFGHLPAPEPLNFFWTFRDVEDGQIIMAINSSASLDVNDADAVEAAMRRVIPEITEVHAVLGQSWSEDPWSSGGNLCPPPGQISAHLRALQQPLRGLAFATTEIANGWAGFIDGAIESGLRAAGHSRKAIGREGTR